MKDAPTSAWRTRGLAPGALLLAAALLGGCATTGGPVNPRDPWEPMNREVTKFNEAVDSALLKPVATAYRQAVPPLVRTGVANVFSNLGDAWSGVNALLQLRIHHAAENFMRFSVNTFFGIGGIFDLASEMNIDRHREDFGQTLGRWGVPAGPYVVLPLLGPSTLRDTLALPVDRQGDLVRQIDPTETRAAFYGLRAVDTRANLLRVSSVLDEAALDKYSFTRDAYLQKRRAEIFEGPLGRSEREPAPPGLSNNDGQIPKEDGQIPREDGQIPKEDAPSTAPAPAR